MARQVVQNSYPHAVLMLAVVFVLALGAVAEWLGFHFVIGVFLAALTVTRGSLGDARFDGLQRSCELMTASLFGPLFLAYQAVQFELGALGDWFLLGGPYRGRCHLQVGGGYAVARLSRLPHHEARGVALVMNARGVMEMVVASIAYRAGLVDAKLYFRAAGHGHRHHDDHAGAAQTVDARLDLRSAFLMADLVDLRDVRPCKPR